MADGGEDAFDRVGGSQVVPVLGRAVEDGQQGLGVLDQASNGRAVFDRVFFREDLEAARAAAFVSA